MEVIQGIDTKELNDDILLDRSVWRMIIHMINST